MTSITPHSFGQLEGKEVKRFVLTNTHDIRIDIIEYGGIITSWKTPDRHGIVEDVVLGFDTLEEYLEGNPYFGAIIGRYGNRIADGKFSLDGKEYFLEKNNFPNHLHGGVYGFDRVLWKGSVELLDDKPALKLSYRSVDGEEGYPGNVDTEVTYQLTDDNELIIYYAAVTDKPTIINLTHHSYFNLTGNMKDDILSHEVVIEAESFLPVSPSLIPVGDSRHVEGTPFDFRNSNRVGERIDDHDEQLQIAGGYDHCWILHNKRSEDVIASVYEPVSGRLMEVLTTEPGIQFYSGNFLDGSRVGKGGVRYTKRFGLCLETQHFPDSPNQSAFPSTVLRPGETYTSKTVYRFSVRK